MTDEIKEILDEFESLFEVSEVPEHIINEFNKVKDCITNLQEENKSNINRIHELEEEIDSEYVQKEYYKSRCEKAIEELDKFINSCGIEAEHTLNNEKCLISVRHSKKVKNILNGGDNND